MSGLSLPRWAKIWTIAEVLTTLPLGAPYPLDTPDREEKAKAIRNELNGIEPTSEEEETMVAIWKRLSKKTQQGIIDAFDKYFGAANEEDET